MGWFSGNSLEERALTPSHKRGPWRGSEGQEGALQEPGRKEHGCETYWVV